MFVFQVRKFFRITETLKTIELILVFLKKNRDAILPLESQGTLV